MSPVIDKSRQKSQLHFSRSGVHEESIKTSFFLQIKQIWIENLPHRSKIRIADSGLYLILPETIVLQASTASPDQDMVNENRKERCSINSLPNTFPSIKYV